MTDGKNSCRPPAPEAALDDGPVAQCVSHEPSEAFQVLLDRVRRDVDARLTGYLDARVAETARHGADVEAMAAAVRDLTLRGGKRLRAALVVAGYRAHDESLPEDAALDAGVAFELLQTYLLVHDDWMDQDELRRGGPSVPAMLRRYHGSQQLGDAAAILAGDYAAALSLDVLSRLDVPSERLVRAVSLFADIQQDVICGQQLDVSGRASPEDLEGYYALKTGSYTVRGPLLLGATLAAAPPAVMAALEEFAQPLGIAFQMQDDLLGTFGDPARTGKPVGEDLRRGKRNAVVLQARSMLSDEELVQLDSVLGNRHASDEDVTRLTNLLQSSGVREAVADRVEALIRRSIGALVEAPISRSAATWLIGAASMIATRLD